MTTPKGLEGHARALLKTEEWSSFWDLSDAAKLVRAALLHEYSQPPSDEVVEAAVKAYEAIFDHAPIWTREHRIKAMKAAITAYQMARKGEISE